MTMKIALLLSVPLVSASVFAAATTQSSNTFGLLRVDSTQKQTIVCVPWVAASATDDQPIPVTDIVKTANLEAGDDLYWYDPQNKGYSGWRLEMIEGLLKWQPMTVVGEGNKISLTAGAADARLARGNAIILVRQNPTDNEGKAKPFYLLGQVASSSGSVENTLVSGAYSLLAPPIATSADSFDLNDNTKVTWGTSGGQYKPNANDVIIVPDSDVTLSWNSATGKWGTGKRTWDDKLKKIVFSWDETPNTKIKSGCGAWYVNGGTSDVKVYWK